MNKHSHGRLAPGAAAFAIAIFVAGILVATLAPFDFHWLSAATAPRFNVNLADMAQNLLLFAPLGFVLACTRRASLLHTTIIGVLLSASVEFAQLSIVGRTSNYVDVITNGLGAISGWIYAERYLRNDDADPTGSIFALVALPLLWIIAIRTIKEPGVALLAVPVAAVALRYWSANLLHRLILVAVVTLPLLYAGRDYPLIEMSGLRLTLGAALTALIAAMALLAPRLLARRTMIVAALCATLVAFMVIDAHWFWMQGSSLAWTAQTHLHWAAAMACIALLAYFSLWMPDRART